jgi:hypothetical protein
MFKRNDTIPASRKSRGRRVAVAAMATAVTAVCALTATAEGAHAATGTGSYQVQWASSASPIYVSFDGMHVAVPESSTSPGTGIIQWSPDGGSEQNWYQNSNLCIQTNGFAGATLYQEPCNPVNGLMVWMPHYGTYGDVSYTAWTNEAAGLNLDVSGASSGEGANIDGWYPNGGSNQDFQV